ncbi:hypothetical protein EUGRSUZ_A01041 [Eucalyptus grandis]|uniref:Uncharacterized protein n=2 Tax=Eucalyptus grandis TaxID=71139 RepID=A0ACC3M4B9_EUCGR|nr:hypothetical protein EUGRSUZ_A01041 [Eucalyptus grandis]
MYPSPTMPKAKRSISICHCHFLRNFIFTKNLGHYIELIAKKPQVITVFNSLHANCTYSQAQHNHQKFHTMIEGAHDVRY